MLVVREQQTKALAVVQKDVLLSRFEAHIRQHFAHVVEKMPSPALREIIGRNWDRAEEYGLTTELSVCMYLNAVFVLGEDFPNSQPWGEALLTDNALSEEQKTDALERRVEKTLEAMS